MNRNLFIHDAEVHIVCESSLLEDSGAALHEFLMRCVQEHRDKDFIISVTQESIDRQAFPLIMGLALGIFSGFRKAFYIEARTSSTEGRLRMNRNQSSVMAILERITTSPNVREATRQSVAEFIRRIEFEE